MKSGEMPPSNKILITAQEAAGLLSLSRATIFEMIRDGRLPSVKVGGSRRIRVADLQAWTEKLSATTARAK